MCFVKTTIWASAVSEDSQKHQTDCSESGPKICTCQWGAIFQFVVSQILNNVFKNILLLFCNTDHPQNSPNSTNTALQSQQNNKMIPRRFSLIWLWYSFRAWILCAKLFQKQWRQFFYSYSPCGPRKWHWVSIQLH